jgi:hypothetical protein
MNGGFQGFGGCARKTAMTRFAASLFRAFHADYTARFG